MNVKLSPKHGLNPSINYCYFCGESKNEIILPGRLPGDEKAPMYGIWNKDPCDKCEELFQEGIMLLEVKDGSSNPDSGRTGNAFVITEEAAKRLFTPDMAEKVLKSRVAFIETSTIDVLGLRTITPTKQ